MSEFIFCKHKQLVGHCDVLGCEHHPSTYRVTAPQCPKCGWVMFFNLHGQYECQQHGVVGPHTGTEAEHNMLKAAHELIFEVRNQFIEYHNQHKLKSLFAENTKDAKAAITKADVNWNFALKCQQFINDHPLPVEVKDGGRIGSGGGVTPRTGNT